MNDYGFSTSDMDISGDTYSESTLEPEPPVEVPDETPSNPESTIEIEAEPEQSAVSADDTQSASVSLSDNVIETISEPEPSVVVPEETPADPPDPGDRFLTRPTYFEAKEGDRNVEDDMVEGNYDLHPPTPEARTPKPGDLDWTPHGPEQGG